MYQYLSRKYRLSRSYNKQKWLSYYFFWIKSDKDKKEGDKTLQIINVRLSNYESKYNEIEVLRLPTEKVLPKYEFKSQWAKRDLNGIVNGDSFKLGDMVSIKTDFVELLK